MHFAWIQIEDRSLWRKGERITRPDMKSEVVIKIGIGNSTLKTVKKKRGCHPTWVGDVSMR